MSDEAPTPRAGTAADLSRRMDAMESKHEELAKEVNALTATVARVEQNQGHATELNNLHFKNLEGHLSSLEKQMSAFMTRIDGVLSGEVETRASREGQKIVEEYLSWRKDVDSKLAIIYTPEQRKIIEARLSATERFQTQVALLGRLVLVLVGGNALTIIGAIGYFIATGHAAR